MFNNAGLPFNGNPPPIEDQLAEDVKIARRALAHAADECREEARRNLAKALDRLTSYMNNQAWPSFPQRGRPDGGEGRLIAPAV